MKIQVARVAESASSLSRAADFLLAACEAIAPLLASSADDDGHKLMLQTQCDVLHKQARVLKKTEKYALDCMEQYRQLEERLSQMADALDIKVK